MIKKRKVVIIGAGHVGSHSAMALAFMDACDEIALIDKDKEKARANCLDIADACLFLTASTKIKVGTYDDCKDADIIVISVGVPRKPGQTRLDLLDESIVMMKDVCDNLNKVKFDAIVITITNPVDVIADYTRKALNLPRERCFSTGTSLDTARLKRTISEVSEIDRKSVSTFSMGEHGNSSIIPFSSMTIGAMPISEIEKKNDISKDYILSQTREIGNEIIDGKGSTEFGIGAALADMVKAIFHDEKRVIPASVLLCGEYNQFDVHAGVPCVIGKNGIEKIIELNLSNSENEDFSKTCNIIKDYIKRAESIK